MDRILNRRTLLSGASALAIAPLLPALDVSAAAPSLPTVERGRSLRPIRGFVVGTGQRPLGAALDLVIQDGVVSFDVNPMTHESGLGPIVSDDPAVVAFLQAVSDRLWAESYHNLAIASEFRSKPKTSGEWIECPACQAKDPEDCETCFGRGAIWRSR